VTVDDLLDEVLVRAWQRFSDRPRHLDLDLWLTELLQDTLVEWVKQEPRKHASLEENAAVIMPEERPQVDEQEWWASLLGDEETFTLGDLIPDVEATEAWEQLEAEEQADRLLSLMSALPPAQRQAFLLHALENYDTAEIATIQNLPEDRVRADIEAARRTLRERLLAGGYVREAGELATALKTGGN
jgi:RNA polymerase sigma factor (sigma-70 family)